MRKERPNKKIALNSMNENMLYVQCDPSFPPRSSHSLTHTHTHAHCIHIHVRLQMADHRSNRYGLLEDGRRHLGVFQHHDGMRSHKQLTIQPLFCPSCLCMCSYWIFLLSGITGTSKDHVVVDYGGRLLSALKNAGVGFKGIEQTRLEMFGNVAHIRSISIVNL